MDVICPPSQGGDTGSNPVGAASCERTVTGNKRVDIQGVAAMVAEVDRRPITSAWKGTAAQLCREWLDFAATRADHVGDDQVNRFTPNQVI